MGLILRGTIFPMFSMGSLLFWGDFSRLHLSDEALRYRGLYPHGIFRGGGSRCDGKNGLKFGGEEKLTWQPLGPLLKVKLLVGPTFKIPRSTQRS